MENKAEFPNQVLAGKPFPFRRPLNNATFELRQVWEDDYRKWWRETYKKVVPGKWIKKGSEEIIRDFQLNRGKSWSAVQIEAAINSDQYVALTIARIIKLQPEQLALVFCNEWGHSEKIRNHNLSFTIDRQSQKGMTDEDIERAKKIAERLNAERQIFYVK